MLKSTLIFCAIVCAVIVAFITILKLLFKPKGEKNIGKTPKVLGALMLILGVYGLTTNPNDELEISIIHGGFGLVLLWFFLKINNCSKRYSTTSILGIIGCIIYILYYIDPSIYYPFLYRIGFELDYFILLDILGIHSLILILSIGSLLAITDEKDKIQYGAATALLITCIIAACSLSAWSYIWPGRATWNVTGSWWFGLGGEAEYTEVEINLLSERINSWNEKLHLIYNYLPMISWGLFLLIFRGNPTNQVSEKHTENITSETTSTKTLIQENN